jgi:hypothetical protein
MAGTSIALSAAAGNRNAAANNIFTLIKGLNANAAPLAQIWGQMQFMVDSPTNPTDFTQIESTFGLATGQGALMWATFAGAYQVMQSTAVQALRNQFV